MSTTQESLYQLKPYEFEELCGRIIKDIIPKIKNVKPSNDVDFTAELNGKIVAIEVKHKIRLNIHEANKVFNQLLKSSSKPEHIILMTSARIKDIDRPLLSVPSGYTLTIIGVDDILNILNKSEVKVIELEQANKRTNTQKQQLLFSAFGVFTAIVGLFISGTNLLISTEKPPLEKRIENVEAVIGNLKDLEVQLIDIKEDMVKTQQAKDIIEEEYEQEYEKMQEVKKLSKIQIEAIKESMEKEEWWIMLIKNVLSFILGVASSIAGSILYSKYKQRKSLED